MSDPQQGAVERSVAYFRDGLYCSEAILRAFNEERALGLPEQAYGIATPLGAGMGTAKCSCGAVTGGQLVLGLARGRISAGESETPAFEAAKRLHDEFRGRYRVICCRGLTRRLAWGTPEHHQACEAYVRFAAEVVESILDEAKPPDVGSGGAGTPDVDRVGDDPAQQSAPGGSTRRSRPRSGSRDGSAGGW